VPNEGKILVRALHFAQRVDQLSKIPAGVDEELCAGQEDRSQPKADIESLRFL
jgi:hypothetical protein